VAIDTLGGEPLALAYTVVRDRGGAARAVYGVAGAVVTITRVFDCTMKDRPLLPPSLIGNVPNDSVLRVQVSAASTALWAGHGGPGESSYAAADSGRPWLGDLVTTVTLRPEVASRLVIGGIPRSRLPALLVVLGVAFVLAVVAMLQLNRSRELSAMRTRFVADVSHELRTPLAQISMFSETLLLARERSPAERQHFLSVIFREAGRLTSLVENVLRFSRGESGAGFADGSRLRLETRDVADDVRDALNAFVPLALASGSPSCPSSRMAPSRRPTPAPFARSCSTCSTTP
jgi:signal transduction histidine kinase